MQGSATIRERPSLDLFISEVDENLLCAICTQVLLQPETACVEGHVFCAACLDKMVVCDATRGLVSKCAVCRGKLRRNRVKAMDALIKNLAVRCSSNQCAWQGKLEAWDAHMDECAFQTIPCPFEACAWEGQRRALPAHNAAAAGLHAKSSREIIERLRRELDFCSSVVSAPCPPEGVWGPEFRHAVAAEEVSDVEEGEGDGEEGLEGGGESRVNWVPTTMAQVHITSGLWHGREGFVTELLGSQCKIDCETPRGRCTCVIDHKCLEPVRPKKNAKVVIFNGELRGKKGTLTGILKSGFCETCVVKTEGDSDIHVLQLCDVTALKEGH